MAQLGDRAGVIALFRRLQAVVTGRDPDDPVSRDGRSRFECRTLGCTLQHLDCLLRQLRSEHELTTDIERGQAPEYPSCRTETCAQGRRIREALVHLEVKWKGKGVHKRFAGRPVVDGLEPWEGSKRGSREKTEP